MQFHSLQPQQRAARQPAFGTPPAAANAGTGVAEPEGEGGTGGEPPPRSPTEEIAQNLLKHVPGEASAFYLMGADSITGPTLFDLGWLFALALIILVVVRWVAGASRAIMCASIFAFLVWMLVFEKGFLHALFPNVLRPPWGLIVAGFYSTVVTVLASAGKIR